MMERGDLKEIMFYLFHGAHQVGVSKLGNMEEREKQSFKKKERKALEQSC